MSGNRRKDSFWWLASFAIAIIIVLLINAFAFTSCFIPSSGMENSLYQGDRVIVNKWSYGLRVPFSSLFSYQRWIERNVKSNDIVLFNNPRPSSLQTNIEDRNVFISRCVGLPGDTLMLNNRLELTSSKIISPDAKSLYAYPQQKEDSLLQILKKLNIQDNELIGFNESGFVRSFSHYEIYLLRQEIGSCFAIKPLRADSNDEVHPYVIPGKGICVRVYPWNIKLLRNTIKEHEGKQADIQSGFLIVEGKRVPSYIFTKDYYWMCSNNSINQSDSRLFGFVPKDHLIGKASFVWFSKDNEAGVFEGFRWNRFFQFVK